jgi:hypothetical protein
MSTIVGNLERRLAQYAEEQQEEQKKNDPLTTQSKRYRGAQQESRLRRFK